MHSANTCPACSTPYPTGTAICAACGLFFASYAQPASAAPPQTALFTYVPLIPGQSLANGRFTVRLALSKGGMGAIYLASDNEAFGRLVVVKAMLDYFDPADVHAVQEARARFVQEARTLSQLRHPAIPQIFSYFQDGPHNYIVMEYIEGHDLEQLLTRRDDATGQLINGQAYPQSNVLRWGVALCQVLVYLAGRQPHTVVHHDIKPANLLLDSSSDDIRLVDFGTAKARLLTVSGSVGLQQSSVHGTQGYAAPEQYRGHSEPRSDVYALAATLYHLATDDDPRNHPFDFPLLPQLGAFGQALRPALAADIGQRPTAAQLQRQLEALAIPTGARPIQAPDGTDLGDIGSLAAWCEQHWHNGAAWLYNQLPAQIELWWGQTKLAHELRAIVARYSVDKSAGLDAMLALLDPSGFGSQLPQMASDQPQLHFGTLAPKTWPERTITLSNPGRRYAQATLTLPDWMLTPRRTIALAPGEQLSLQLLADRQYTNKQSKLAADILIQNGNTTLLRVEALAKVARWPKPRLLAVICCLLLVVFWQSHLQALLKPILSPPAVGIVSNATHYQAAVASMSKHDWDAAIAEFWQMSGTYNDSAALLQQSYYNSAALALQHGDWFKARARLKLVPDYSDARKLLEATYSLEAQQIGALLVLDSNAQHVTLGPQDKLLLTPLIGEELEIRGIPDGKPLHTIDSLHNSLMLDADWSPDGRMIALSYQNGLIKIARADDGTTQKIIEGGAQNGHMLAWSPDGQTLASSGPTQVELWRAEGTLRRTLTVNQSDTNVTSIAFSPDGQIIATGSFNGSIKLWRVSDGVLLREITAFKLLRKIIFSDQGRVIAASDGGAQLGLWQVRDGSLVRMATMPPVTSATYAFSPDGQVIAAFDREAHGVKLWRVADGQELGSINLQSSEVVEISYSNDSKRLAILDNKGGLVLIDVKAR